MFTFEREQVADGYREPDFRWSWQNRGWTPSTRGLGDIGTDFIGDTELDWDFLRCILVEVGKYCDDTAGVILTYLEPLSWV